MTDYLQVISTILRKKGFSFSTGTLNNLLEILPDEKKEQLMRAMLSIREYKSPERHFTSTVSDDFESRESILSLSESFLYFKNLGFSRFDFIEEFFDDLTKEQRIAFLKLFIDLNYINNEDYSEEDEGYEEEDEGYEEEDEGYEEEDEGYEEEDEGYEEDEEPEDGEYDDGDDGEYDDRDDGEYDDGDDGYW